MNYIGHSIPFNEQSFFENADRSIHSDFFPLSIIDREGRIRCRVPRSSATGSNDKRKTAEHDACVWYRYAAFLGIVPFLDLAKQKHIFDMESLRFLVEESWFVPNDRKETFLKGIVAGFNQDWPSAMHLLMPQVENAIRCLAQDCGIVVYKTYPDGVEECLSLSSILDMPEVAEYLDEKLLFNMRVFFTSEYGIGMRNMVCHGLLADDEYEEIDSILVWGFVLFLCCISNWCLQSDSLTSENNG